MIYPLFNRKNEGNILHPTNELISEEYAKRRCNLYLSDEFIKVNDYDVKKYYRLNATTPHSINMALAYDILCPRCKNIMKPITGIVNEHKLGLYTCRYCDK